VNRQGVSAGVTHPSAGFVGRSRRLIALLRLREAVLMTGFPVVAAVLGVQRLTTETLTDLVSVAACLCAISVSVYAANAWAGWREDAKDPKFSGRTEADVDGLRGDLAWVSLALLLVGTGAWAALLGWTAVTWVPMWILWLAYSHPRGLKRIPLGGTIVHLTAGPWLVLVPYSVIGAFDARGVIYAISITLAFGSGHLNHELVDRLADASSGLRTTAVAFGARIAHFAGSLLAGGAYLAMMAGAWLGHLSTLEAIPFLFAGLVHGCLARRAGRSGMTPGRAVRYRSRYRLIFAAAMGAAILAHGLALARA
jgi:4-hydroxybenzoate polyprenyltransferase